MVARTLLLRPKLIIADEPVSMVDASLRLTVLRNLLQLKQEFGISLIYITHDLATAYQISDRIIVLHRGVVVEEGHPEQVVKHPRHAYTQLLISSIPSPDPEHGWGGATTGTGDDQPPARPADAAGDRPAASDGH
jgi:peptide/nickel transport system ATP-binding protein